MSRIKNFIKGRAGNTKRQQNTEHIGSLCIDNLSGYYQLDYETPRIIREFMKTGKQELEGIVDKTKADSFNDSMLDRYIHDLIILAKEDIDEQRLSHERAIKDIKMAQLSRIQSFRREVERIDEECSQLRKEVG